MGAKEVMGRLAYEAKDIAKDAVGQTRLNIYADGYGQAADISLGFLDQKIDSLMGRIKSGNRPSDQELILLGSLHDLRKEMEQALDEFWKQDASSNVRAIERR